MGTSFLRFFTQSFTSVLKSHGTSLRQSPSVAAVVTDSHTNILWAWSFFLLSLKWKVSAQAGLSHLILFADCVANQRGFMMGPPSLGICFVVGFHPCLAQLILLVRSSSSGVLNSVSGEWPSLRFLPLPKQSTPHVPCRDLEELLIGQIICAESWDVVESSWMDVLQEQGCSPVKLRCQMSCALFRLK